jgi:Ca-activated chloride channel family protein
MNNDEHNSQPQDQVSAELEARMLAWLSGEASAQEAAELERLVAEKPMIAAHRRRIEAVIGLLKDGLAIDKAPMRLSDARRAALLREIGAPSKAPEAEPTPTLVAIQRKHRIERQWMMAAAACLTIGLFLSLMFTPAYQRIATESSKEKREQVSLEKKAAPEESREPGIQVKLPTVGSSDLGVGEPSAPASAVVVAGASKTWGGIYGTPDSPAEFAKAAPSPIVVGEFAQPAPFAAAIGGGERPIIFGTGSPAPSRTYGALRKEASLGYTSASAGPAVAGNALGELSVVAANFGAPTPSRLSLSALSATPALPESRLDEPRDRESIPSPNPNAGRPYIANATSQLQDRAEVESEAPTVLSPFVVDATEDKGSYKANSTLAGTRIRTDLKDVASSINVVSAQFLQDTGARNASDLLAYEPGAEVAGLKAEPQQEGRESSPIPGGTGFEETNASREAVSTFSLHVSDVSFQLARAAIAAGAVPDPSRIRPEEFYNAFNYDDPAPAMAEKVSCRIEQAADPFVQQRELVRIAIRVPTTGRAAAQPLRLTVLLDTSGSMEREDRAAAVRSAFKVLVSLLGKDDRVTLVGFARQPRLLADQVPGDKAQSLLGIIRHTPPDGGTNLEEAINLAGELAERQFMDAAQNRVVLLTDGAANLGDADPSHLSAQVEKLRQRGIAFDACGVGTGGIDDSVLEALTRKGSGRYYVLDSPEAADAGFARQLAGAFHPAAENVKVQVRFNPSRVGNYRLIGFENHRLNTEDFRNDKVAAAALAGGEAAVALYVVEVLPQGDGDLGQVYVRFHDTASAGMVERSWPLVFDPNVPAFDKAAPSMQLAGTAAFLAEKLRGGARADAIKLPELAPVVDALRAHYGDQAQVQELAAMYEQMRRMRIE